jgi:hypothetical protein
MILAWSHTNQTLKMARKVALIAKTHLCCDFSDWHSLNQQRFGMLNPELNNIGMWRKPNPPMKHTQQMKRADVNKLGQLVKRHWVRKMGGKILPNTIHVGWLLPYDSRRVGCIGVACDQLGQRPQESRFAL